ncbi:MAG: adenylate/guanylate cyclase domain-containing protein [Gammaproteobacteria bacterium]|nr:adenylate/guanylate cyclase domain-containing protein [Gammaproteobacteria bacterium]
MEPQDLKTPPSKSTIRWISLLLALLVFALATTTYIVRPKIIDDVEGRLMDARFLLRGAQEPTGQVAIVAVDDRSLDEIGRWPWSRLVLADLIEKIKAAGAIVIGLDIVFSEAEKDQILQQLREVQAADPQLFQQLKSELDQRSPDDAIADVIAAGQVVSGHFFYTSPDQIKNPPTPEEQQRLNRLLAPSAVTAVKSKLEQFDAYQAYGATTNIDTIAQVGPGSGYFNFPPGSDGVIRDAPLILKYHNNFYPSLAIKTLDHAMGDAPIFLNVEKYGISHISLLVEGGFDILTNELGAITINYAGPAGTIPTYSAVDILHGAFDPALLQDRIVLLGVTAIGVYDAHTTPFGPSFPGLEIQANALENIIQGNNLSRTSLEAITDVVTMLLIVLVLAIVMPRISNNLMRLLFALLLITLYTYGNYYLFVSQHLWVVLVYPLLTWLVAFLTLTIYLSLTVESYYSTVRDAFKSYLHPDLVEELTKNAEMLKFGGDSREISILFSDIRSFTNISEKLTPVELARFLKCYMDPMTEQVLNQEGTLDKYIGDAVMALFGAPRACDHHPIQASETALQMIAKLDSVRGCCPDLDHIFPINIGVGIHSGEAIVGNLGSSFRFTYTALGDSVNLASRLEGLCKPYGVHIVISEATKEAIGEGYITRELDKVRVKGKEIPITIYELCGRKGEEAMEEKSRLWLRAMDHYQAWQWSEALEAYRTFLHHYPEDKCAEIYIERSEGFINTPPLPDWDGVLTLTTK